MKKGHSVTIIGRHIPGDLDIEYTSPFAGAVWQSSPYKTDKRSQDIDAVGYHKFMELARTTPSAGVFIIPYQQFVRPSELNESGEVKTPWFANVVENFRMLDKSEVPDTGEFSGGYEYSGVTISTTLYLNWLLQQCFQMGVQLKRRSIKHINEGYDLHQSGQKADLIINCTGILAHSLGGVEDKGVYPIRGQVLWVRNTGSKQCATTIIPGYANETFYLFPRKEGGSVIGGCSISNDWSSTPDPQLTKRIIARALKYAPEIVDEKLGNPPTIEVFRENVGHRPARKGGVRVEREGKIIHNYGIGPAGYQAGWGHTAEVIKLVDAALKESKL